MESESEKFDQATSQNWQYKTTTTLTKGRRGVPHEDGQKQQTKTTKHTIEFSNNTPGFSGNPAKILDPGGFVNPRPAGLGPGP
ncbi:hypothetical protein H7K45_05340 [Mycobacterium yunnanensis]|uniref:Uncharacterized protein n=1 Tax=Mycobacterium yunnanensis TaxID=368477 RepID=A0A9X2YWS2_9MYCO|nr:hypothetical protein [Mycobacterium yunnanensis]MCV7419958.1 hypothetical protein [Mycobacterium yunnanensis]